MVEDGLRVECYSGWKADERPTRIWLRGVCLEIEEVEDRWYSPGVTFFRVIVAGGDRYVLKCCEGQERWELEGFRAASSAERRSRYVDTKITRSV